MTLSVAAGAPVVPCAKAWKLSPREANCTLWSSMPRAPISSSLGCRVIAVAPELGPLSFPTAV